MNIADNPGPSLKNKFHFISNRTKTNKDISKGKVENPMVKEELMDVVAWLWIVAVELHSHWLSLLQLSVSHKQECTYVFPFLRLISKQLSGIGNLTPQNLEVVPKKIKFF